MRETNILPSVDYLRKRLRYEPDTGKLFWLDYEGASKEWRTRWVGKEAFTALNDKGYYIGSVDNVKYRANRVAWAIYYGEWPEQYLDHINGVTTDDRISNLRDVSHQENHRNSALRKNNTSGVNGVSWSKSSGKWRVHVNVGGKYKHLGYFNNIEEAAAVRKQADVQYGYSERHGLPTNVGEACD